jgi:hypothetical protein
MKLTDDQLKNLQDISNRSKSQTEMLYGLVEYNYDKLIELELKIKKNHIFYCPGDLDNINEIINER